MNNKLLIPMYIWAHPILSLWACFSVVEIQSGKTS